eukprot:3587302-Amphidinium_carterae.1
MALLWKHVQGGWQSIGSWLSHLTAYFRLCNGPIGVKAAHGNLVDADQSPDRLHHSTIMVICECSALLCSLSCQAKSVVS